MIYCAKLCFRDNIPEIKDKHTYIYIYVLPDLLVVFFSLQIPKNIVIMTKKISISDKSILFDGCLTAKLGKK